jgi:hypothetical protein
VGDRRRPCSRNLASERAGEFYEEVTRGRRASHHLQVKAALALLCDVLGEANPFKTRIIAEAQIKTDKVDSRHSGRSATGQPHFEGAHLQGYGADRYEFIVAEEDEGRGLTKLVTLDERLEEQWRPEKLDFGLTRRLFV